MKHHSTPITDQLLKQFKTMSQTKHTPGPWKIVTNGSDEDCIVRTINSNGPTNLSEVCIVTTGSFSDEVELANAEFIASAPETAAERDRLKEDNEALRQVMATVYGTLILNGINTHHMKKHVKAMNNVLNGRESGYELLIAEMLEAMKQINRWVATNFPEHGMALEYGTCATFNKLRTAITKAEKGGNG